jgi:hypothetical protein
MEQMEQMEHEIQATEKNVPETFQPLTSGNHYESEGHGTFGTCGTFPRRELSLGDTTRLFL